MSLNRLEGTSTFGGHYWWETTSTYGEWKIQHHKTHLSRSELKPYRLLDPDDRLIASADSEVELKEYLDNLLKH